MPQLSTRNYSSASFSRELEDVRVGFLHTVEGGEPFGKVINEPVDQSGVVKKHIGSVSYQPIVLTFGTRMDKTVYQWIVDMIGRKATKKSGAIIFGDYNYKERLRLEFDNALITEIGFPALDGASKEAAFITLTLQPQVTRLSAKSLGAQIAGFSTKSQKQWLASNFRLRISGLETACVKVNAIEPLSITQTASGADGIAPGVLSVPNLLFTVAESAATDIVHWADDFLIKGQSDQANERSGTLEFLDTSLKAVLFTLTFSNLGVIRTHRLRTAEDAGVIARVSVELYCEQMSFAPEPDTVGSATVASTPTTTIGAAASISLTDTLLNIIAARLDKQASFGTPPVIVPPKASQAASNAPDTTPASAFTPIDVSEIIARRLLTTLRPVPTGPVAPKWDDGVTLGEKWATDTATIGELNEIKTINQDEWSALKLEPGHSLIDKLRTQGVIPDGMAGPLQLERDPFVEGIVAGAIEVLNNATPHLTRLTAEK